MKPKVLFIMHTPPPVHGAAMMGQYIKDSKLINESFNCIYINPSISDSVASVGRVNFKKIFRLIGKYWEVFTIVIKEKPDLCYFTATCSGWGIIRDAVMVGILKLCRRKIVLHLHNKGVKKLRGNKIADFFYRIMFTNVKVILLSELLYEDVSQFVKREDVYICPNGIPDTAGGKEPSAERHNKIPHLLFLSNLLESKGVIVLLDALKILKDKGYSFVCNFVGAETKEIDAARFQKEVESRGLNQLAVYDGRKYGSDKEDFYNKADIFVFPTYYPGETFGLVNLEAMEHKIPVVSTNIGGIPDVIKDGENGLISEKGNSLSLADCITELLDDEKLRERMGEEGYRKYKEDFTVQAFEKRMKTCLSDMSRQGGVVSLVFCWGKRFGLDKERFLHDADIFVFPTYYPGECFPLVLLEAMQHGLPCITTKEGGIPSIIEDGKNGLLVKERNGDDLADKIAWLIDQPEVRQAQGTKGYNMYKSNFTIGRFERNMNNILSNILSNKR